MARDGCVEVCGDDKATRAPNTEGLISPGAASGLFVLRSVAGGGPREVSELGNDPLCTGGPTEDEREKANGLSQGDQ